VKLVCLELFLLILLIAGLSSCGLEKAATGVIADSLSKPGSTVFTGENDPELVGDALPFALKFYEAILEQNPDHTGLLLAEGSAYIMYANAYIQSPAAMLPSSEYEKKNLMLGRAKNLYIRGRDMVLKAINIRHSGFSAFLDQGKTNEALAGMAASDVPYLYWAAAGWVAAFSVNGFDINLSIGVTRAVAMMNRALELDETFLYGAIHDFFTAYYGSMPQGMGGDEKKARFHFQKAVEISKGLSVSPYISLATGISVKNQDLKEFKDLMKKALAINVNENTGIRLANVIGQRKAKWYLDHSSDFFIEE
jgi:predicted anti-sigma-YlaC factor YlaD